MRTVLHRTLVGLTVVGLLAACEARREDDTADPASAADAERGAELFADHCAVCHGAAADGTPAGPPLVHEIYEPSHHSDAAFQVAVAVGVQPHHWDFGPMAPVDGLGPADVADITAWVRERQREAGIE